MYESRFPYRGEEFEEVFNDLQSHSNEDTRSALAPGSKPDISFIDAIYYYYNCISDK